VDEYSKEEIAEFTKGVEDPSTEIYRSVMESGDVSVINNSQTRSIGVGDSENHDKNSVNSAVIGILKIETLEAYDSSNKSGDNASDDANVVCATDQPQSSAKNISSPNTIVSPLELVEDVLRSPKSSGKSVSPVDKGSVTSCIHGAQSESKLFQHSTFMVGKLVQRTNTLIKGIRNHMKCNG